MIPWVRQRHAIGETHLHAENTLQVFPIDDADTSMINQNKNINADNDNSNSNRNRWNCWQFDHDIYQSGHFRKQFSIFYWWIVATRMLTFLIDTHKKEPGTIELFI